MKKRNRFAAMALAALLLAGSAPSALALDATPPMYEQLGYTSKQEFLNSDDWDGQFHVLDYDKASDLYRQHLAELRQNPLSAAQYWGVEDLAGLDDYIAGGAWTDREACFQDTAWDMLQNDDWQLSRTLSVQLNGASIGFPDAEPEKVNGRVMVPFRAIAEALGAEVDYNAGAITAKKNGQTLAFSLGGKQLTITDDSTGKVIC